MAENELGESCWFKNCPRHTYSSDWEFSPTKVLVLKKKKKSLFSHDCESASQAVEYWLTGMIGEVICGKGRCGVCWEVSFPGVMKLHALVRGLWAKLVSPETSWRVNIFSFSFTPHNLPSKAKKKKTTNVSIARHKTGQNGSGTQKIYFFPSGRCSHILRRDSKLQNIH